MMAENDIVIKRGGGFIGAFGPRIDMMANETATAAGITKEKTCPYHITLITKDELRCLSTNLSNKIDVASIDSRNILSFGHGGDLNGICWTVIIWNAGNIFRKKYGLPVKQFHITLSNNDDHSLHKGLNSLCEPFSIENCTLNTIDHIVLSYSLLHQYDQVDIYAREMCTRFPNSEKGWLRLADVARQNEQYKLAMLAYGHAMSINGQENEKIADYCLKKISNCAAMYTEWGCLFGENELEQIPEVLKKKLFTPWTQTMRQRFIDVFANEQPQFTQETRIKFQMPIMESKGPNNETLGKYQQSTLDSLVANVSFNFNLEMFSLPRYFRWIVPFYLSIMSTPRSERDIDALASLHIGIRHIVTLTEEEPLPEKWFFNKTISHTHLPVKNYYPPTIEQVDLVFRLLNDPTKIPLLVHCGGGKGRAGTMIACYLAVYGFQSPLAQWTQPVMSAGEAITKLRQLRPGSIETDHQERFVQTYLSTVWKRQSVSPLPPLPDEPKDIPLEFEGHLDGNIDFVMLCGLPGCGKSHMARMMSMRDDRWTIISQDEIESREICERVIGRPGKYATILDRCNPNREDRKRWLALAHWVQKPICVYFDYDAQLCTSRAQQRADHPTLMPGQRVRNAVQSMKRQMTKPSLDEGFAAVCIIRSFDAANELIQRLTPVGILKFLRTGHLMNLGAVTETDFVVSFKHTTEAPPYVVITEKVDGANMGFSLSADRKLLVQNRSHYICGTEHAQFRPLSNWIEEHREGLYSVLDRDNSFPERYILYGEWLVAQHSIPYTRLPDRFLAFDLYDRQTQTWADRDTLERLLASTNISLVNVMYRGPRPTDDILKRMVRTPSQFYDGPIEGIYVKEERNGQVINRGKIVRSDFIAGTEHWNKAIMKKNGFVLDPGDVE